MSEKSLSDAPFAGCEPDGSPEGVLGEFYDFLFSGMERIIRRHQTFGGWSLGSIPDLVRVPTQTELGLWYAEWKIPGIAVNGGVGLLLVAGELRLGLYLPAESLHSGDDGIPTERLVSEAYDGKPSCQIRRQADRVLFDWILSDSGTGPFGIEPLCMALDAFYRGAVSDPRILLLMQRLAYMVTTVWVNSMRVLLSRQTRDMNTWLVRTLVPVTPDLLIGLRSGVLVYGDRMSLLSGEDEYLSYIRAQENEERVVAHLVSAGIPAEAILSCSLVQDEVFA